MKEVYLDNATNFLRKTSLNKELTFQEKLNQKKIIKIK